MARTRPTSQPTVPPIDQRYATALYRTHRHPLADARAAQRELLTDGAKAQLDDIEAELTYLFVRDRSPGTFPAHLLGRVSWVASIDPRRGALLRAAYDRIDWT